MQREKERSVIREETADEAQRHFLSEKKLNANCVRLFSRLFAAVNNGGMVHRTSYFKT